MKGEENNNSVDESQQVIAKIVDEIKKFRRYRILGYILLIIVIGFFIIRYYNKKLKKLEETIRENVQELLEDARIKYNNVVKDDTYLIWSVRTYLFKHYDKNIHLINMILNYQSSFSKELIEFIEESIKEVDKINKRIKNFNIEFIERRKKEYNDMFIKKIDENLKTERVIEMDDNQKNAIIKDDKHNIVVAGAGAGKTEVLTTRIAYLIKRKPDSVDRGRILALAFQNKAKKEMIDRLKTRYGLEVKIKTFHALGLEILELENQRSNLFDPDEEEVKTRTLIKYLFNEALEEKKFHNELINYLKSRDPGYIEEKTEFASEEEKEEFYQYMRSLRWRTLDSTEVKSAAERDIMNFFLTHKINDKDINILYEEPADWAKYRDDEGRWKSPRPDFFFPDPDFNIYIEHWALDKNNNVPYFFEDQDNYIQTMNIKRNRFADSDYNKDLMYSLVESYNWEFYDKKDFFDILSSRFLKVLKEKNPEEDFILTPIEHKELIEKIWNMCKVKKGTITDNILNFIKIAKTYGLDPKKIEERLKNEKWSPMQKIFGRIACRIYADYEDFLKSASKIDFQDMINLCVKSLKKNPNRFKDSFDHILIDEYQDISKQRYELIKLLMDRNPNCKLFCVGDDWQSIMGFAGSNLKYFVRFGDFFDHEERTDLTINYRNIKTIVDAGADLIKNNRCSQIDKKSIANNQKKKSIVVNASRHKPDFYKNYYEHITSHCIDYIDNLLENNYKPSDIAIMTRIYKNPQWKDLVKYSKFKGIKFWSVHKFKGLQSRVVILMDVTKGLYGFPCELEDSLLFEPANEEKNINKEDEERRLFYVALTRAEEELIIYSQKDAMSKFIDEIKNYINYNELVY
jgi:DNA helicase IV